MLKSQLLISLLFLISFANCDYGIECSYYFILKEECQKLSSEIEGQFCYFDGGTCKSVAYLNCEDYKGAVESECLAITPSDFRLKCSYDDEKNECKSIKRKCEEYDSSYIDSCWALEASIEGKRCIEDSSDFQCKEAYKQCEDYSSETIDEDTCKNIRPYIKDTNDIDYSHKCVVEDNACVTKQKLCEDHNSATDYSYYCSQIKFDDNPNKACSFGYSDKTCHQIYTSCGLTNYRVKCDIKNSKCVTLDKECQDFDTSVIPESAHYICKSLTPSDKTKQCILTSDKRCVEVQKKCEQYTGSAGEECQLITPYLDNNKLDYYHICIYEGTSCKSQLITCESQTDSINCDKMILSETKRCLYFNGKCQEFYKKCEDYKGTDGYICAKIIPFKSMNETDEGYECVLEKNNKCTKKKKEEAKYCNYQGYNEEICAMLKPSDPDTKICSLISGRCVEQYKYCSDYKGIYSEECQSIVPYDPETNKIDPYSKCDLWLIVNYFGEISVSERKCVKKGRRCSEYYGNDPSICSKYHAQDENKKCVLKGNICTEQYKTCETYTGNDINECQNIILSDYTKKCVFQDSRCQTKSKTCSEFNKIITDFLGNICESRSLNDYKRKCLFQSGSCLEHVNTCEEITFANENEASEEKCNAIWIYSYNDDEICTLKRDKSGCRRISKSDLEEEKRMEEELKKTDAIIDENSNLKTNTIVINNIDSTIKYNNEIDSDSVTDYKSDNITDNATNTNTNRNSGGKNLNIIFGLISISLLLL